MKIKIYGRNAMHFAVNIYTKRFGWICFRLPFFCFGRWWPLYFYVSPNATPWASTYMIGRKEDIEDWSLARVRFLRFGHNFDVEKHSDELWELNGYYNTPEERE